jgi:hypothetical protein
MAKPVALITAFSARVLPRILDAIADGPQPPAADWFVGTYGVNERAAELVLAAPGCRYAPVFGIQPHTSAHARKRRHLPRELAAKLDRTRAGAIPGGDEVVPPSEPRAWGIELGRRFRDQVRAGRAKGIQIDAWQLDELLGQCASSTSARAFVGGLLRGLAQGRRKLGDTLEKGFVWSAASAVARLPGLAITEEVQRFWEDLDLATLFLVGEEYPAFRGDAFEVGRGFAAGQRALLASGGEIRKSLGRRYVVGMTPGWIDSEGLLGNVDGKPLAFVTTWRKGFMEGRTAGQAPRGFAHFNFVHGNAKPNRLEDAVKSLHRAAERLL